MSVLFSLDISCVTEENIWAEYHIGLFQSTTEVDIVKNRLMTDGGKFSKPDCKARVSEVKVVGDDVDIEYVYRFWGQNIDSDIDECIIESACYIDKSTAIKDLLEAKEHTPRQQWRMQTCIVGKSNW